MGRADTEASTGDELDLSFTRHEIVLLVRYSVAKGAMEYMRPWFLLKWLALVPAFALLVASDDPVIRVLAVFLLMVFVLLFLGQRLFRRALARLGAFRRLQRFDDIVDDVRSSFRDEIERATGLSNSRKLVVTAIRFVRGRAAADAFVEDFYELDWSKVLPIDRVYEARAALDEAAHG